MKERIVEALGEGMFLVKVMAIISVPVALLMFHVWNQFRITDLGYEVAEQTEEHRELLEEQRRLRIEATFQGHSERATQVAAEEFDLEPVRPEQVIRVDDEDEQPDERRAGGESAGGDEQAALRLPTE